MIYCTSCGTENVDAAQFCYKCGAVQVPASSPPSWPGSSPSNNLPTGMNNSTGGYYPPTYSPNNYPPPYVAPYPYGQPPPTPVPYGGGNQTVVNVGYMPMQPQSGAMSLTGMILGIVAAALFMFGLIPCLGWINWFTLIIGVLANIFSWIGLSTEGKNPNLRGKAVTGLILSFIAVFIGVIRLIIGHGIL